MNRTPPTGVFAVFPVGAFVVAFVIGAWTWLLWTLGVLAAASVVTEVVRAEVTK